MTKIFISHRRKDKGYAARGINDALSRKFGKLNVYFDLDSILVGLDWRKQIDEMVAKCDVMIVVIGDDWLEVRESGRSRLADEDDLVHFEVSTALKRDIPVIPVLVGNASIPDKEKLPDALKPLHYRQAVEVRDDANFNAHIEKLLIGIEVVAPDKDDPNEFEPDAPAPSVKAPHAPQAWLQRSKWIKSLPVILAVGLAVIVVGLAWQPLMDWMSKDEVTSSRDVPSNNDHNVIQKYALTINPEPTDAKIRFLSTGQEYQPGVLLVSGSYHVEVSRPGYVTQTQWLEIESHDLNLNFVLKAEEPEPVEESTEGQIPEPKSGTKYVESEKYVESGTTYVETPNIQSQELPDKQSTTSKSEQEKEPEFVAGQAFKDCDECPEMVVIPDGNFMMGGSGQDEYPVHQVSVSSFAMGRYEVTFHEYDAFAHSTLKDLPDDDGRGRGERPVIHVSWEDAQAYVGWLSKQTGKRYRLPSEAEWEYSARAGTSTTHWWGKDIDQDGEVWANCGGCGSQWAGKMAAPVGRFPANPFGLYDTAGNVWEWVEDCWHEDYSGENRPNDGSAWLEENNCKHNNRVFRSGAWDVPPRAIRPAIRLWGGHRTTSGSLGFRVAQDLE